MFNEKIKQVFINIIIEVLKSKDIHIDLNNNFTLDDLYEKINSINFNPPELNFKKIGNIEFYFNIDIDDRIIEKCITFKCNCVFNDFCCNEIELIYYNINNNNRLRIRIDKYDFMFDDDDDDFDYINEIDVKGIVYDSELTQSWINEIIEFCETQKIIWNITSYLKELKNE